MAWRTAGLEPARVLVPALVIFGLDAFQSTFFTEIAVDHLGLVRPTAVVFGVLDARAHVLQRHARASRRLGRAQRDAPADRRCWRRCPGSACCWPTPSSSWSTALTALFLVIPGLVVGTLFALVGPLINLLDCSVPEAFRRSIQVVWPHFFLVLF